MAIRKLGRTADHRMAMLKNQVTEVIWHEKITTTEEKAKEVKSIVDSLIALAIKEKDNFEMVEQKVSRAKVENGKKATEPATSKNGKKFDKVVREEVTENVKKDMPSRLAVRRKLIRNLNKVKDSEGNAIDLPGKMLNELAERYADRKGGYTRIIKLGKRKGDNAEEDCIHFSDYGYDIPEDGVYVTEEYYNTHRETVEKFNRATCRGWDYCIEHPDKALDIVMKWTEKTGIRTNRYHQSLMLKSMNGLIVNPRTGKADYSPIPEDKFNRLIQALIDMQYISSPTSYKEFIK